AEVAPAAGPRPAAVEEQHRRAGALGVVVDPEPVADVGVRSFRDGSGGHALLRPRASSFGGWCPHSLTWSYSVGCQVASSTSRAPQPTSNWKPDGVCA